MGLSAVIAAAAALASCGQKSDQAWQASTSASRICVDAHGRRLRDQDCTAPAVTGVSPVWYFLAADAIRSRGIPRVGADVEGGSYRPASGVAYVEAPSEGVARGGFGGTADAAGHGAGE